MYKTEFVLHNITNFAMSVPFALNYESVSFNDTRLEPALAGLHVVILFIVCLVIMR
jgi:hypothetical protein